MAMLLKEPFASNVSKRSRGKTRVPWRETKLMLFHKLKSFHVILELMLAIEIETVVYFFLSGVRGSYRRWDAILSHFKNDLQVATNFVQKRRKEGKGTSKCRNTGEETFLLFEEETRTWTYTTLVAWLQVQTFCMCTLCLYCTCWTFTECWFQELVRCIHKIWHVRMKCAWMWGAHRKLPRWAAPMRWGWVLQRFHALNLVEEVMVKRLQMANLLRMLPETRLQRSRQSRRRRSQQPPSCNICLPVYYLDF